MRGQRKTKKTKSLHPKTAHKASYIHWSFLSRAYEFPRLSHSGFLACSPSVTVAVFISERGSKEREEGGRKTGLRADRVGERKNNNEGEEKETKKGSFAKTPKSHS